MVAAAVVAFAVWTQISTGRGGADAIPAAVAVAAVVTAGWLIRQGRDGAAFAATSLTMAATVSSIFVNLYPRVMVSTLGSATDLTVTDTASSPYSLRVMTVVAAVLFPVILVYQGWTYHVFRRRISRADVVTPARRTQASATGPPAATGNSDSRQEAT